MTIPDHDPAREALIKIADDLDSFVHDMREDGNDASALWLEYRVKALRRLAAQDQKPVAYLHSHPKGIDNLTRYQLTDADKEHGWVEKPLYSDPPPAAGWDEVRRDLIEFIASQRAPYIHPFLRDELIEKVQSALRHNAPPDTSAGKSDDNAGLRQLTAIEQDGLNKALLDSGTVVSSLPDHGGADAGVGERAELRDLLQSCRDWLNYAYHNVSSVTSAKVYAAFPSIDRHIAALSHQPAPVAANASAEQWATELPDGSVSFDAYAGWSRDQLKDRCLDLIGRIEQLEEAANASAVATYRLGRWLAAALEDPNVCAEMKADIDAWIDAGQPNVQPSTNASAEARLREALEKARTILKGPHHIGGASLMAMGEAYSVVDEALSAHPHASDCDKQGER